MADAVTSPAHLRRQMHVAAESFSLLLGNEKVIVHAANLGFGTLADLGRASAAIASIATREAPEEQDFHDAVDRVAPVLRNIKARLLTQLDDSVFGNSTLIQKQTAGKLIGAIDAIGIAANVDVTVNSTDNPLGSYHDAAYRGR